MHTKFAAQLSTAIAVLLAAGVGGAQTRRATPAPSSAVSLAAKPALSAAAAVPAHHGMYQLNDQAATGPLTLNAGTYAVFHTSDGDFIAALYTNEAPNTTRNFIDLAQGKKSWKHPVTMLESNRPLYNNTTIYRIISDTIIFGGDPINKGAGDSGTMLPLESAPALQFDEGGVLAMDGNGSLSSGSRWFVTLRPFPDRNGHYTIIGKVIGGLDVVATISNKPTKKPQVPLDATLLSSIEIVEIPQGKKTAGTFATEDGKRVLSIDRNFTTAEEPKPAPAADTLTSATEITSSTAAVTTSTATNP